MSKGQPGADSASVVTNQIGGVNLIQLANQLYGVNPVFWGRYFSSASAGGPGEYIHLKENPPLRNAGIRVLPIAQQTRNVSGSFADGSTDAQKNIGDLLATFGAGYLASQGGKYYMFLDVEGSPSLSPSYWAGWASTISAHSAALTGGSVQILPCVYATQGDTPTWVAILSAGGGLCRGAWVARWLSSTCLAVPDWDATKVTPSVALPFPVLIWQYAAECHGNGGFDCSVTNPAINLQSDLLDFLILPPASTTALT